MNEERREDDEMALLGAILTEPSILGIVRGIVSPEMFYFTRHKEIYTTILKLADEGKAIDPVAVAEEMKAAQTLSLLPKGALYLHDLVMSCPTPVNARAYAELVKRDYVSRALRRKLIEIARSGAQPEEMLNDLSSLQTELLETLEEGGAENVDRIWGKVIEEAENFKESSLVFTGFYELDNMLGGLKPGQFIIIAGRPSTGKSSFLLNILEYNSSGRTKHPRPILLFSLEDIKEDVLRRLAIMLDESLDMQDFFAPTQETIQKLKGFDFKRTSDLLIVDRIAGLDELEAEAQLCKAKYPELNLVAVDYLQLLTPWERGIESENRLVAEISSRLKRLAKKLRVPIIAVSQLSRALEHRADRRPRLSDLRSSGTLEQDADVVMFLWHPEDAPKEEMELLVEKNRNGPTGAIRMRFIKERFRFEEVL